MPGIPKLLAPKLASGKLNRCARQCFGYETLRQSMAASTPTPSLIRAIRSLFPLARRHVRPQPAVAASGCSISDTKSSAFRTPPLVGPSNPFFLSALSPRQANGRWPNQLRNWERIGWVEAKYVVDSGSPLLCHKVAAMISPWRPMAVILP